MATSDPSRESLDETLSQLAPDPLLAAEQCLCACLLLYPQARQPGPGLALRYWHFRRDEDARLYFALREAGDAPTSHTLRYLIECGFDASELLDLLRRYEAYERGVAAELAQLGLPSRVRDVVRLCCNMLKREAHQQA